MDPRETPGLVVFRNRNQKRLLLLFLIGETPTFGIHEKALSRALDAAAESCGPRTLIRLMAPTFTGSAMSRRAAIERWWDSNDPCPTARFKIISGSASDFRNKEIIEQPLRALVPVKPGPAVSFRATVIPEEAILNAVYQHLKDLGADLTQEVALLAEAGTSYGKSAYGDTEGPLVLTFPMRLGRLRSTGGAEASLKAGASTPNGQGLLRLGLDELGAPSDLFPTFFPRMHNPSDELVLGHLLSTISKEKYRYVGLLATDPRDKLYLARLIRQYCPDVALVHRAERPTLWWWASPAGLPLDGGSAGENDASVGRALFALRSANLQSGVSVLTPLLFVTLAVYLLAFAQLKRLRLLRERRSEPAVQERLAQRFGSSLDHTGAEHRGWGEVSTLEGAIEDTTPCCHGTMR